MIHTKTPIIGVMLSVFLMTAQCTPSDNVHTACRSAGRRRRKQRKGLVSHR